MERTITPTKTKLQKEKDRTKKGEVSIRDKKNGKEARVTLQLNIPGAPNPRISKYGANESIARKRLAEAILLKYIELQKNKEFANIQVFSPECQIELNKFDEYMECVRNNQLKANGDRENKKDEVKYPIFLYVEKMIKQKRNNLKLKALRKRKK